MAVGRWQAGAKEEVRKSELWSSFSAQSVKYVMIVVQIYLPLFNYDKVSANTASSVPKCYKKSDRSQDARRGYSE